MSLVVVGLNHRTAAVDLLERMTVPPGALPKALHALAGREHLAEVVLLSTCNRTEVYARTTRFHPGVDDVRHHLAELAGVDPDVLAESLYTYHDDAAVAHLFGVAAGLDSMIIGEGEILGQVFGITLLDIEALRALGEQSLQQRRAEVGKVRVIITEELDRFRVERSARQVAPVVAALRARAEELRATEIERRAARLDALDPAARAVVEQVTRGVVNKLLHEPTIRVKDAAGTAQGELLADALADLFALDDPE